MESTRKQFMYDCEEVGIDYVKNNIRDYYGIFNENKYSIMIKLKYSEFYDFETDDYIDIGSAYQVKFPNAIIDGAVRYAVILHK